MARNYKTKEKMVIDFVLSKFPDFTWITDKRVQDGCSRRRPDMLLDLGYQVVVVEIDENQHRYYDCSCQNKRLMELSQDVGHRNMIFIRFNPDAYKNERGVIVKSCWSLSKLGIVYLTTNASKEWNARLLSLTDQIEYWCNNRTDKTIETIQLYYDQDIVPVAKVENKQRLVASFFAIK